MSDNRNFILAIALSITVLVGWEYFFGEGMRQAARQDTPADSVSVQPQPGGQAPAAGEALIPAPQGTGNALQPAQTAAVETARIAIDTPRLKGSIAVTGGRLDDLALKDYRETVERNSPNITLLSPVGSEHPYFADFGWWGGAQVAVPNARTVWTQDGSNALSPGQPVTLRWDNGAGLLFTRQIAVDENYLFTVTDTVENTGEAPVALNPYARLARFGLPQTSGFYLLHEGLIGVAGEQKLQEMNYADLEKEGVKSFAVTSGWFGITDKYWATALVPPQNVAFTGRFVTALDNDQRIFQADTMLEALTIAPGATESVTTRLFAGAKEVGLIDRYEAEQGIYLFDRLIDWGWFYYITKNLFYALDFFFHLLGNFGLSILVVTVLIKLVFFPLANKSYKSMAKMKIVQPEMMRIRDRWKDDRMKQQQEMMELYKREKINPVAGCWPVLIQIPVFFALYKVLFVTIEMRHAPFFGWIRDLSAPDPTTVFNLFGLIPWDPPSFLMLGVWPLIMGVTMFLQMRMNPTPPDPTQAMIFTWMPVFFTYLLASFPAGLVIYWAWNNFLSILQQGIIMKRSGAKIELWDNLKSLFSKKPKEQKS